ncbi:unnamed protein product [Urochloa decumbens]|uniref:Uncharacterized protein n=1 Tax=Urochloa decumbens TaxID=240449 RepID=A0ABC8XFN6_9POAL
MSSASGRGKPSRSSSIIIADRPSGYHELKIDACLLADTSVPNGEVLLSCPFTVGGHRWRIQTYPNGNTPEAAGYVSLFLLLNEDVAKPVTAQMQFSVMVERSALFFLKWKKKVVSTKKEVISLASQVSMGYSKFDKRETLLNELQRKGDPFTIRCAIVVHNESRAVEAAEKSPKFDASVSCVPPASDLSAQLGDLLSTERGADVVFQVGGETFAAHRAVLAARSPVFAAELFSVMKEGDAAAAAAAAGVVVRVDDMEPRVFQALLRFAYTDLLPPEMAAKRKEEGAMCQHLLVAADRYGMERLKLMCEDKLCRHIDVGTAAIILTLAEQHRCSKLKKACLQFVSAPGNLKAIVSSDGFEHLSTSCPSITKDLIAMLAS